MEESDRKLVKAVSKRGSKLVARSLPTHVVEEFHAKIEGMGEAIKEVDMEERAEKHLARAEMEAIKAENLMEHHKEIHSRPKRDWFQTERDKKIGRKASLKASEREDVDDLEDVEKIPGRSAKKTKGQKRKEKEVVDEDETSRQQASQARSRREGYPRKGKETLGRRRRARRPDDGQARG